MVELERTPEAVAVSEVHRGAWEALKPPGNLNKQTLGVRGLAPGRLYLIYI